jgi:CDP-diacylglycerol---serine O-phosphatidyltransferase
MKRYIPNLFTFLNMGSGLIALIFVFQNHFESAALFVFLGVFFDFFDGFFARIFKVQSAIGLQLDSLADMITSGVVPGAVVFFMLQMNVNENLLFADSRWYNYMPYLGFVLTMAAGYRLAKFNIDTRQTVSFIGVPTPAMSIFVLSLPLVAMHSDIQILVHLVQSTGFLIATVFVFSYLMNCELPLFALKFKSFDWQSNAEKYIFMGISILLLIILGVTAFPLLIILYILISTILFWLNKQKPLEYQG